jgi:hypothetical protein
MNQLRNLLDAASRMTAADATYNPDGSVRHVVAKAPASVLNANLRQLTMPPFLAGTGMHQVRAPKGTEAGKQTTFSAALLQASRVSQAGARIILVSEAMEPQQGAPNAVPVLARVNSGYTVIEAAPFALVADGAEVTESPLAVYRDLVDVETMPAYGFRVALSRAEQKAYEDGQLADCALSSIALGVANMADRVLLSAIAASTPAAFSLGAAAALGLEFAELRALIGTAGTGAAVGQDGTLRAAGVLAELTNQTAETIVGSFSRAAVAVHEDMRLVAERTNKQGELILTCWVNAQALMPLPGAFWKVGA